MVLRQLTASAITSVVPVGSSRTIPTSTRGSPRSVTAPLPSSSAARASTRLRRGSRSCAEIPERSGEAVGEIAEATLEELVGALSKQVRTGILSVHGVGGREAPPLRLVLSSGRALAEAVDEFVRRVRPLVTRAEPVVYEFHDQAGGTIELLGSEDSTLEADARRVAGMRLCWSATVRRAPTCSRASCVASTSRWSSSTSAATVSTARASWIRTSC